MAQWDLWCLCSAGTQVQYPTRDPEDATAVVWVTTVAQILSLAGKLHMPQGHQKRKTNFFLTVLEGRSPISKCWQVRAPASALMGWSPLASSNFSKPQMFLACSSTPISASVFIWLLHFVLHFCTPLFSLARTLVILDRRPAPLQYDLILTNCICNEFISKSACI